MILGSCTSASLPPQYLCPSEARLPAPAAEGYLAASGMLPSPALPAAAAPAPAAAAPPQAAAQPQPAAAAAPQDSGAAAELDRRAAELERKTAELEAARREAAAAKEAVAHEVAIMRRQLDTAQAAAAEAEKVGWGWGGPFFRSYTGMMAAWWARIDRHYMCSPGCLCRLTDWFAGCRGGTCGAGGGAGQVDAPGSGAGGGAPATGERDCLWHALVCRLWAVAPAACHAVRLASTVSSSAASVTEGIFLLSGRCSFPTHT